MGIVDSLICELKGTSTSTSLNPHLLEVELMPLRVLVVG